MIIGWAAHELIWLDAAVHLPRAEHTAAFRDIASMTGRSLIAVQARAYRMWQEKIDAKINAECAKRKAMLLAMNARREARKEAARHMAPSMIPAVTMKQLMAGRAR